MKAWQPVIALLFVCAGAQALGVGCKWLSSADQINDPKVDSDLWACRQKAGAQYQFEHDAGAAWAAYDDCVRDGGYR